MNTSKGKLFITSALPYVNGRPHAGNLSGSTLGADLFARFKRKEGFDVKFICGTDDYGSQTEHKALTEGLSCEDLCNKYRAAHEAVYAWFNLSFDYFGKTPTAVHTQITKQIINLLYEKNLLHEKTSEQYFCEKCDRFVCDRFIHGVCYMENNGSICGGIVKGDECEKCCKMIDIDKITKKWCSVCNSVPIKKETKHLYFDLAPYKQQLTEYFLDTDSEQTPNSTIRKVKYMSTAATRVTREWLNKDLTERCVTRDLKYGTPLPTLEELSGYDTKVVWPWFDAPIGYISILANAYPDTWKEYINPDVDWVQFMAKDNVPFHTIVFPATLIGSEFENLGCGVTHLPATEYLLFNGEKFSKSGNVGIFGDQIMTMSEVLGIDEDYWRYYMAKIRPETGDSTFTFEAFCDIIKGELAQKMGNLINRGVAMVNKYYVESDKLVYDITTNPVQAKLLEQVNNYIVAFNKFSYHEVIGTINRVAELGNEWINANTIWVKCKDAPKENESIMGNLLLIIWLFAELAEPIMPKKAQTIKSWFVESTISGSSSFTYDQIIQILTTGAGSINVNCKVSELLFKQIKIEEILALQTTSVSTSTSALVV